MNQIVNLRNQVEDEKNKDNNEDDELDEDGDDDDYDDEVDGYVKDDWGFEEDNDAVDQDEIKYAKILEGIDLNNEETEQYESLYGFSTTEIKGYIEPVKNIKIFGMFSLNFENNVNLAQFISPKLSTENQQVLQGCIDLGKKELMC